tara:strand:- start:14 stop:400 length:387 start_codon:yes stop_codon:yes gene_type:complete
LAPTYVISQELNITGLNKGEEAPFTGILLTKAALAKIEADLRLEVQLCENNCKLKLDEKELLYNKDVSILKAEIDGLNQFVEVKNKRINRLEEIIDENNNSWFVPVVAIASFVVGVATTVGITYAVNK